jgi:fatty-acyl-CoA synthase
LTLVNTGEKAMGDDNAPNAPHPEVAQAASPARAWLRALENTAEATSDPHRILPRAVADWARSYADAPALVSDRECFSFRDLEKRMNQYSRWALAEGIQKGETVALMMGNRPEYFVIWLGLIQVGAVVALLGSDLRAPAIAHALKAAGARRIIASAECADVCRSAVAALGEAAEIWIHGSEQRETRSIELAALVLDSIAVMFAAPAFAIILVWPPSSGPSSKTRFP